MGQSDRRDFPLILEPNDGLTFRDKLGHIGSALLTLKNHGRQPVYFKIKSNASKFYAVRPSAGMIIPYGQCKVNIAPNENTLDNLNEIETKKHRFKIQAAYVEDKRIAAEEFWCLADKQEQGGAGIHTLKLDTKVVRSQPQQVIQQQDVPSSPISASAAVPIGSRCAGGFGAARRPVVDSLPSQYSAFISSSAGPGNGNKASSPVLDKSGFGNTFTGNKAASPVLDKSGFGNTFAGNKASPLDLTENTAPMTKVESIDAAAAKHKPITENYQQQNSENEAKENTTDERPLQQLRQQQKTPPPSPKPQLLHNEPIASAHNNENGDNEIDDANNDNVVDGSAVEAGGESLNIFAEIQRVVMQDVGYIGNAEDHSSNRLRLSPLSLKELAEVKRAKKMAKLSPVQRDCVNEKKRQLELNYRNDCEAYGLVVNKLIANDRGLEDRIKAALLNTMKQLETEAMKQLDEFMDQLAF